MTEPSSSSHGGEQKFGAIRHGRPVNSLMVPYARSRASSHSSIFEDAKSAKSDDLDDTLEMLAAEIYNRKYPTQTPVIMENSPGPGRSTSNTSMHVELPETCPIANHRT